MQRTFALIVLLATVAGSICAQTSSPSFQKHGVHAEHVLTSELLTFFGGSGTDSEEEIYVRCILYDEKRDHVIIVGWTEERDHPVTPDALQGSRRGWQDGYITVFDAECTRLIYSSYIGGSGGDAVMAAALLDEDRIFLALNTSSPDLPIVGTRFGSAHHGERDVWFASMSLDDYRILESGYFGGRERDAVEMMLRLADGRVAVVGGGLSSDIPVTANAFQKTGGTDGNAYFLVFDTSLALQFCSYHGGRADEDGTLGRLAETEHYIVFTGETRSYNMPVTANAYQPTYAGGDAYLVAVSKDSMRRVYSTFLGGSYLDMVWDCISIGGDRVFLAGLTASPDFPVTSNAWQPVMGDTLPQSGRYPGDVIIGMFDIGAGRCETLTYFGDGNADFARSALLDADGTHANVFCESWSDRLPFFAPRPSTWINRIVLVRFDLNKMAPDTVVALYDVGMSQINTSMRTTSGLVYFAGKEHSAVSDEIHPPVRPSGYRTKPNGSTDVFIGRMIRETTSIRAFPPLPAQVHVDIAPHPVRDELRFRVPSSEDVTVRVRDLLGRIQAQSSFESDGRDVRGTLGVHGMPSGVYMLEISSRTQVLVSRVVVLNRR
jgi:hypothetical protein